MLGMGSRSCRAEGAAATAEAAEGPGISSMERALRGTLTAVAGFLPRFEQTEAGEVGPTETEAEDGPTLPDRPEKLRFFEVGVCDPPAAAELFWRLCMLVGQVAISPDSSAAELALAGAETADEVAGGVAGAEEDEEAVDCRPSDADSLG